MSGQWDEFYAYKVPDKDVDKVYAFDCNTDARSFGIVFPKKRKIHVWIPYDIENQNQEIDNKPETGSSYNYNNFGFGWETSHNFGTTTSKYRDVGTFGSIHNNRLTNAKRGLFTYADIANGIWIKNIPKLAKKIYIMGTNSASFGDVAMTFAKKFKDDIPGGIVMNYWDIKVTNRYAKLITDIDKAVNEIPDTDINHCLEKLRKNHKLLDLTLAGIKTKLELMKKGETEISKTIEEKTLKYRAEMDKLLDPATYSSMTTVQLNEALSNMRGFASDLELERAKKTVFDEVVKEYKVGKGSDANIATLEKTVEDIKNRINELDAIVLTMTSTAYSSDFELFDILVDKSINVNNHDIKHVHKNRKDISDFVKTYTGFNITDNNYEFVEVLDLKYQP